MGTVVTFREFIKQKRLELDLSLREFCRQNELDVGNMSKMERGLIDPPKSRTAQEKLACALRLKPNSEDWSTFFDLAALSTGRLPERIMSDKGLVAKLPLLFRKASGQSLTKDELRELAELIRGS